MWIKRFGTKNDERGAGTKATLWKTQSEEQGSGKTWMKSNSSSIVTATIAKRVDDANNLQDYFSVNSLTIIILMKILAQDVSVKEVQVSENRKIAQQNFDSQEKIKCCHEFTTCKILCIGDSGSGSEW